MWITLNAPTATWHDWKKKKRGWKKEKWENIFKDIVIENLPDLMKYINLYIQKAQKVPNRINVQEHISEKIIIKMLIAIDKETI